MTRSDVPLCSWNSLAPLAGTTGLYLSRSVSAKQSGWLHNLGICKNVCTLYKHVRDTSRCDQRFEAAPHCHAGKHITKRHRRSSWSMEKAITCKHEGKMTSLWTSAKLKPAPFHSQHTTQPALFRATNSLPRKTRCFALFPSQPLKK